MKCDELKEVKYLIEWGLYYDKEKADAAIAELKDKIQMHDFFWEGCGFAKRGFKNAIAVSEAFDRLEAENAELKKKLMPCLNGDCILTCEVVEKYGKENAELKQKLEDVNELIKTARQKLEDAKASHYAEMVDAGMRERRLRRALWLARAMRAYRAQYWGAYVEYVHFHEKSFYEFDGDEIFKQDNRNKDSFREWNRRWVSVERKCRAKAEEYK